MSRVLALVILLMLAASLPAHAQHRWGYVDWENRWLHLRPRSITARAWYVDVSTLSVEPEAALPLLDVLLARRGGGG